MSVPDSLVATHNNGRNPFKTFVDLRLPTSRMVCTALVSMCVCALFSRRGENKLQTTASKNIILYAYLTPPSVTRISSKHL